MWDDAARGTVSVLLVYESAILAGDASAWMAAEARHASEALGLTPRSMLVLGWQITRMSNRRKARLRDLPGVIAGQGGIPRVLGLGPCIEAWAAPVAWGSPPASADEAGLAAAVSSMRRFCEARTWWLGLAVIEDERERGRLVPVDGNPFPTVVRGVHVSQRAGRHGGRH